MRAKFSWSFLHCGKVVSLAVLYATFFAGSTNVLAQEGSATISPAAIPLVAGETTDIAIEVRVEGGAAMFTRVLETSNSTPANWVFATMPSSGIVVFVLADGSTALTTQGSRSTVAYTLTPPPGIVGFGRTEMFTVQSSTGTNVVSTANFTVTVPSAGTPPLPTGTTPTFDVASLVIDSHQRVPSTDFVVRLSTESPTTVTLSFNTPISAPLMGVAAFVESGGSTATTLSVNTTAAPTPVTVRFTRPVPDGGFTVATAFEVVATDDDTGLSGRVDVVVRNVANSTPTITGPSAESLSIHQLQTVNTFTFNAGDFDRGERPEDLRWNLEDGIGDRSTAVFVDGTTESIGTETVQVRFSQAVNTFTAGVSTRTFTLTLSDGLATARSTVTVVIEQNQPPVIALVDGQDTREQEAVTFTISPNSTVVTFPVAATKIDFPAATLSWRFENLGTGTTPMFVVGDGLRTTATGTSAMVSLERATTLTTGTYDLIVSDSLGEDSVTVNANPEESTSTFMLTDLQPISEGNSVARRFSASHGLGQSASLTWTVTSTDNVVVTPSSAEGETAVFTATLQDVVSRLDGRYVLTVTNADDNSTSSTVMVSVANEHPVITVPVIPPLAVGETTARIDYEATDETGVVTLTWTIVDVSAGSTVGFVVGESTTETTTGSAATVSFEGAPRSSSEEDTVATFTVQVTDGFGGSSTALTTVRYLPEGGPFIFYQGSSLAETLMLTLEPGDSTASTTISLMARGGGAGADLTWSLSSITASFTSVAFDNSSTQISTKSVVIEAQLGDQQQTGSFVVEVRHGGSDVSDSVTVTVTRGSLPSGSRFRIRVLLGGAVR